MQSEVSDNDAMTHIPEHDLMDRIELVLKETGMKKTAFGREAINDQNLVDDLAGGRELRRKTRQRVELVIEKHLIKRVPDCLPNNVGTPVNDCKGEVAQ